MMTMDTRAHVFIPLPCFVPTLICTNHCHLAGKLTEGPSRNN